MAKMIFVNFPVSDLQRSTAFYQALGFKQNAEFSDQNASSMMWDDQIWIMLLKPEFYQKFLRNKQVADTQKTSGALVALSLDSIDDVKQFAETAKANGGDYYHVEMGIPTDMMYGLEVTDPDGNGLEPTWMKV